MILIVTFIWFVWWGKVKGAMRANSNSKYIYIYIYILMDMLAVVVTSLIGDFGAFDGENQSSNREGQTQMWRDTNYLK